MQTAGTSLQLAGAVITALGLLYAWNRASRRFDEWRDGLTSTLVQLRAKVTHHKDATGAELVINPQIDATATVTHPGKTEDRLDRIEDKLSELPGKISEAIDAAIDEKIAEFDATGKGFAVKDISVALCGIGVQVVGYVLSLLS